LKRNSGRKSLTIFPCFPPPASVNGDQPIKFTIRIENASKPDAFTASNGTK